MTTVLRRYFCSFRPPPVINRHDNRKVIDVGHEIIRILITTTVSHTPSSCPVRMYARATACMCVCVCVVFIINIFEIEYRPMLQLPVQLPSSQTLIISSRFIIKRGRLLMIAYDDRSCCCWTTRTSWWSGIVLFRL